VDPVEGLAAHEALQRLDPEPELPDGERPLAPEPAAAQPVAPPPPSSPPPAPAVPVPEPEAPRSASLTLRVPDESANQESTLALGVEAGGRERVLALVRNTSGIVDNYALSVRGMPDAWWSIFPDTVYLVPFGTGGTYEQEVEVHLHPPRSAEAEARVWPLEVVAESKANGAEAAAAPFMLGIQPFEELATKLDPERASGRRKARYAVRVENKANAAARVALEGRDTDGDCEFAFAPQDVEIPPGETLETTMTVRPPKQIWLGRPLERRLEVRTSADEAWSEEPEEEVEEADGDGDGDGDGAGAALLGHARKGIRGPRVGKPRLGKPGLSVGPGGVRLREPNLRGPQVRGPQLKQQNVRLDQLKMPGKGAGGVAAPAMPLLPTQAVFRQKPWLPWWLALVLPLLLLLALLLFLFLPKSATVPEVVGKKSAFEAEQAITEAKLRLTPGMKEKVDLEVAPGTVIAQTPAPGEEAEEGTEVAIEIAVGDGKVTVPDVAGQTPPDAEKTLREAGLSLGQATPQPVDPKAEIKTQIPTPSEVVNEGKAVDVFMVTPKPAGGGAAAGQPGGEEGAGGEAGGGGGGGAGGAGGEGAGGPVKVPPVAGATREVYAKKVADLGLAPQPVSAFDEAKKGTLFQVSPRPGTEVQPGETVTISVSAGAPQLAYDDDQDVLLKSSARGAKLDPVAKGPQRERDPAWSGDGSAIAYTSDGQVFLKNLADKDGSPIELTKKGEEFRDLEWAPTADVNTLALIKDGGGTSLAEAKSQLCFGAIDGSGMRTTCKPPSENLLGRKINWAPDGRSLLVFAAKPDGSAFGMMQFTSEKPFSAEPEDWQSEGFVTDTSKERQGALDAVISPDGKQLVEVVLAKDGTTNLVLTKADDFLLAEGKELGVRACKAIWRPDGLELVVVRSESCLGSDTGELVRLPVADPRAQTSLGLVGDNPVFQPLSVE
jgi:beta-lactam-binding protein with PASTA domain